MTLELPVRPRRAIAIVFASLWLLPQLPARAQLLEAPPPPPLLSPPAPPVPDANQRLYESGVRLRRFGRPLTIAGAVAVPVGIAFIIGGSLACTQPLIGPGYPGYYPGYHPGYSSCGAGIGLTALGALLEVVGLPSLGGGIALWVIGNQRIRHAYPGGVHTAAPPPPPCQGEDCPPASGHPVRVDIGATQLRLSERVYFDFDKDTIQPVSFPLLDEVARVLRSRPDLGRVRIEGHTDVVGTDSYNLDLSQRRAAAVMRYLIDHGVELARLSAIGYGKRCLAVNNDTPENQAMNRRVDFVLMDRGTVITTEPARCPPPRW